MYSMPNHGISIHCHHDHPHCRRHHHHHHHLHHHHHHAGLCQDSEAVERPPEELKLPLANMQAVMHRSGTLYVVNAVSMLTLSVS